MQVTSTTSSVKRRPSADTILNALRAWGAAVAERREALIAPGYFGSHARGEDRTTADRDSEPTHTSTQAGQTARTAPRAASPSTCVDAPH